ncbi:mannitol dehydrogenase family protein [Roseobacter denitrificans]|uniref:D-mannonate oxidoreductase, putative n=1 Tax=Roseobacter denitrificans (strain ATCC 33942 / OCh 114) TaxID=375451 RepID=Q164Y8_ROSDO|nr:mannitol dehydrogenase family protein [Roseobacter denitrificans]ABG32455.1 D-mannonate oxidoreductase, putative [Roseobacter denitrificans OCh 114]AVL51915.1 mannitol dehydrogenase family protein [Roseobacter denitrificans]SFF82033.1 fructuronate reductase [Roseobacter denitrificans OCh 114]
MTMPPRLQRQNKAPGIGMVHLGPGAFFRAFNAVYTDEAMALNGGDWGILAVSLQSARAREELAPQGCVYTSVSMGPEGEETRLVNAISDVMVAPQNPDAVLRAMARADVKIVSLTITEKGYCRDPSTGGLDVQHPDVQHDLSTPAMPKTAPGLIVKALARRRAVDERPFSVLSCDNLPDNGATTRRIILEFARKRDPELAAWIAQQARFPSTMVDRITPATTPADIDALAQRSGYHDAALVRHEAFRQWVIEDDFVDGLRPAWDKVGAQFVTSVTAHEKMKLRCLNGTHSTLAYLGYLAGYETIAETVADASFAALCTTLWHREILPTIPAPEGEDLQAYVAALLARYQNPAIRHLTWQIAMDGSQKLPQRILGTIADGYAAGRAPDGLCLAVAGWMRYVGGVDENGAAIDVRDPLAARLRAASDSAQSAAGKVDALLDIRDVFDEALASNPDFRRAVHGAYETLVSKGAGGAVADYVARGSA